MSVFYRLHFNALLTLRSPHTFNISFLQPVCYVRAILCFVTARTQKPSLQALFLLRSVNHDCNEDRSDMVNLAASPDACSCGAHCSVVFSCDTYRASDIIAYTAETHTGNLSFYSGRRPWKTERKRERERLVYRLNLFSEFEFFF